MVSFTTELIEDFAKASIKPENVLNRKDLAHKCAATIENVHAQDIQHTRLTTYEVCINTLRAANQEYAANLIEELYGLAKAGVHELPEV